MVREGERERDREGGTQGERGGQGGRDSERERSACVQRPLSICALYCSIGHGMPPHPFPPLCHASLLALLLACDVV